MTRILLSAAVLLLICCGKVKIEYRHSIVCTQEVPLAYSVLADSLMLSFPLQIEPLDSLLVVADYNGIDCFYVFNKNGSYITSFGTKGRGPGELISPCSFCITPQKEVAVYDYNQSKIVTYRMDSLSCGGKVQFRETKLPVESLRSLLSQATAKTFRIADVLSFEDGRYLVLGNNAAMRYGWFDGQTVTTAYTAYPDCLESGNSEEIWSLFGAMARVKASPDRTKIVHATYIGAVMQLFALTPNGAFDNYANCYIYPPKYGIAQGAVPAWITSNETTVFGFYDLCVTDRSIFALINKSGTSNYPDYITELDWKGNPIRALLSPQPLVLICGDESGFYAIATDAQSGRYSLISLHP